MIVSIKKLKQAYWIDEEPSAEEQEPIALDFAGSAFESCELAFPCASKNPPAGHQAGAKPFPPAKGKDGNQKAEGAFKSLSRALPDALPNALPNALPDALPDASPNCMTDGLPHAADHLSGEASGCLIDWVHDTQPPHTPKTALRSPAAHNPSGHSPAAHSPALQSTGTGAHSNTRKQSKTGESVTNDATVGAGESPNAHKHEEARQCWEHAHPLRLPELPTSGKNFWKWLGLSLSGHLVMVGLASIAVALLVQSPLLKTWFSPKALSPISQPAISVPQSPPSFGTPTMLPDEAPLTHPIFQPAPSPHISPHPQPENLSQKTSPAPLPDVSQAETSNTLPQSGSHPIPPPEQSREQPQQQNAWHPRKETGREKILLPSGQVIHMLDLSDVPAVLFQEETPHDAKNKQP